MASPLPLGRCGELNGKEKSDDRYWSSLGYVKYFLTHSAGIPLFCKERLRRIMKYTISQNEWRNC